MWNVSDLYSRIYENVINNKLIWILDKPILKRIKIETIFGYLKGYVNLTCEAVAEPPAEFLWYRNGKKLQPRAYPIYNGPHASYLQVSSKIIKKE
jgi:hypothetical protein